MMESTEEEVLIYEGGSRGLARLLWLLPVALVFMATVLQRDRSQSQMAVVDVNAAIDIAIVALTIGLILVSNRLFAAYRIVRRSELKYLVAYYGVCLVSSTWSLIPSLTLYRAIEFLSQFFAIFIASTYYDYEDDLEEAVISFSFLVMLFDFGSYLRGGIPQSLYYGFHTNSYTIVGGMIFLYLASKMLNGEHLRLTYRVMMLVSFGIFLLGTSTGSYVSVGLAFLILSAFARRKDVFLISAFAIVFLIAVFGYKELWDGLFIGKPAGRVGTLSGRQALWADYINMFKQKPLTGYGFVVAGRTAGFDVSNSHNSLFSSLIGTGILGTFFLLAFMSRFVLKAFNRARDRSLLGLAIVLMAGFINCFTLPLLGDQWFYAPSFVFFAFYALLLRKLEAST